MSRFSSLFDALSDKKARFFSEKQIINDMIYDYYYSNNKSSFLEGLMEMLRKMFPSETTK